MTAPATAHKESYYQTKILRWLRDTYPAAFIWKAAAGPYSQGGIPDICAIIDGHFYGFEVKRPEGGRLSKLQELTIQKINAAGGTAAACEAAAEATAKQLEGLMVKISAKAGEGGRLFGAVTGKEISDALSAQHGLNIPKTKLVLDEPIKSCGSYQIKAKLGYEISGTVNVLVVEG